MLLWGFGSSVGNVGNVGNVGPGRGVLLCEFCRISDDRHPRTVPLRTLILLPNHF